MTIVDGHLMAMLPQRLAAIAQAGFTLRFGFENMATGTFTPSQISGPLQDPYMVEAVAEGPGRGRSWQVLTPVGWLTIVRAGRFLINPEEFIHGQTAPVEEPQSLGHSDHFDRDDTQRRGAHTPAASHKKHRNS